MELHRTLLTQEPLCVTMDSLIPSSYRPSDATIDVRGRRTRSLFCWDADANLERPGYAC
jgi:hypothetical protein